MLAFVLLQIIFVLFCVYLIILEITRVRFNNQYKHLYSPRSLPFIGNGLTFIRVNSSNFIEKICNFCEKPVTKFIIGNQRAFFVYDADVAKEASLSGEFLGRPAVFSFFQLKYGVLTAQYQLWRQIRRPVSAPFNHSTLLTFMPLFNEFAVEVSNALKSYLNQGTFNLSQILVNYATQQLCEFTLGYKRDIELGKELFMKLDEASAAVVTRMMNPLYYPEFIFKHSELSKRLNKALDFGERHTMNAIDNRRPIRESNSKVFVDKLIEMENPDDPDAKLKTKDNVSAIVSAGYETTAISICATILLLAMHPEVDQKLYEEIMEHHKIGEEVNYETFKKMTYLDKVVKESLRLFPSVPISSRRATRNTYIEGIGNVPKDYGILINTFKMHRAPEYWGPNPLQFDPENFSPENIKNRHPYCYMPFALGPRNCIGMHYANLNIRLFLIHILSHYRFTTKLKLENLKYSFGVVLRLANGYLVEIHERKSKGN